MLDPEGVSVGVLLVSSLACEIQRTPKGGLFSARHQAKLQVPLLVPLQAWG